VNRQYVITSDVAPENTVIETDVVPPQGCVGCVNYRRALSGIYYECDEVIWHRRENHWVRGLDKTDAKAHKSGTIITMIGTAQPEEGFP
jgi:hypothetical protein